MAGATPTPEGLTDVRGCAQRRPQRLPTSPAWRGATPSIPHALRTGTWGACPPAPLPSPGVAAHRGRRAQAAAPWCTAGHVTRSPTSLLCPAASQPSSTWPGHPWGGTGPDCRSWERTGCVAQSSGVCLPPAWVPGRAARWCVPSLQLVPVDCRCRPGQAGHVCKQQGGKVAFRALTQEQVVRAQQDEQGRHCHLVSWGGGYRGWEGAVYGTPHSMSVSLAALLGWCLDCCTQLTLPTRL